MKQSNPKFAIDVNGNKLFVSEHERLGIQPEKVNFGNDVLNNPRLSKSVAKQKVKEEQWFPAIVEDIPELVVKSASVFDNLQENSYILLVNNEPVFSGLIDEVQTLTKSLVFGEHEWCQGEPIPIEQIIVLKRVQVRIGLFVD